MPGRRTGSSRCRTSTGQALLRLDPALDVTVIPNGVDLEFYRPGVTPPLPGMGARRLVFTGKMDYRPNVDAVTWFADAVFPLIRQSGARRPFLHRRAAAAPARRGAGRATRHRRHRPVPDTRPYIAGAGVYVVPLRIGGGTRLKVLEAMAMGQALVSTRLGCDGFPFTDGREVAFARRRRSICRAGGRRCCGDPRAGRADWAAGARAFVEAHYGWDAIVPQLEALYA